MGNSDYGTPEQRLRWEQMEFETKVELASFHAILNKFEQIKSGSFFDKSNIDVKDDPLSTRLYIPASPPGTSIDANIKQAREAFDPLWFVSMVAKNKPWDYKTKDKKYENFGNFNYGATALAFGFKEEWALRAAGFYHIHTNVAQKLRSQGELLKSILAYGASLQGPPYGDDAKDQAMIKYGFQYYKEVYSNRYRDTETSKEFIIRAASNTITSNFPGGSIIAKNLINMTD